MLWIQTPICFLDTDPCQKYSWIKTNFDLILTLWWNEKLANIFSVSVSGSEILILLSRLENVPFKIHWRFNVTYFCHWRNNINCNDLFHQYQPFNFSPPWIIRKQYFLLLFIWGKRPKKRNFRGVCSWPVLEVSSPASQAETEHVKYRASPYFFLFLSEYCLRWWYSNIL